MQFDIFEIKADEGFKGQLEKKESCAGLDKYSFRFDWHPEKTDDNSSFEIKWRIPMPGIMYRWNPVAKLSKNIKPDWAAFNNSIISYSAPVEAFFDGCGENKYTWALDECAKTIFYKSGVVEEDGTLECVFKVPVKQFTGKSSAVIGLRIDKRKIPLRKALAEVSEWWAYDCGMTPAYVPSEAK